MAPMTSTKRVNRKPHMYVQTMASGAVFWRVECKDIPHVTLSRNPREALASWLKNAPIR